MAFRSLSFAASEEVPHLGTISLDMVQPTEMAKRRAWAGLACLATLSLIMACEQVELPARVEKPNVIIYLVDTLRRDYLGVYGNKRKTAPRRDLDPIPIRANVSWSPGKWSMRRSASPSKRGGRDVENAEVARVR